jgi:hypothetical protein
MRAWSKRKIFRTVWFTLVAAFFIWNWSTFQSRNLPEDTFLDSGIVEVSETDDQITFKPIAPAHKLEVIFFQGGLTDPRAYGPLCKKIAESGFTCHLIKMDWRLPIFNYKKTTALFELRNGDYAVGGHSQGARAAAQIVHENPGRFKGLFLMGSSNPKDINLSNMTIPCVKLYAERDGLASVDEVMQFKGNLPEGSELIMIKGGNHSQFGYLGKLFLDEEPGISLEEQQQQTLDYLVAFFLRASDSTYQGR